MKELILIIKKDIRLGLCIVHDVECVYFFGGFPSGKNVIFHNN